MTNTRPEYGVQLSVWRMGSQTLCLDYRTIQVGWLAQPPGPTQHVRVLLDYDKPTTPAHLLVLAQRLAQYMMRKKQWNVTLPHGIPFHEVGGEAASVPPGGGEGGAIPEGPLPGQEPFPGLEKVSTIVMPPTSERQESVSEAKPKRRRSGPRLDA